MDATKTTQARRHQERQRRLLEELQRRKAAHVADYRLPLAYPAKVTAADSDGGDGSTSRPRTSQEFVNARLQEAGMPLGTNGGNEQSLAAHAASVGRFARDLEGTGCYDAVQVHVGPAAGGEGAATNGNERAQSQPPEHGVTVRLKEKNWYKLYIGGGVNADDLSSLGTTNNGSGGAFGSMGGAPGAALAALPKLQFETSASLLNLTGFADVSSASYFVDQAGSASFRAVHDRPLASYLNRGGPLYEWLMPADPRTIDAGESQNGPDSGNNGVSERQVYVNDAQFSIGGGSQTTLGVHAAFHDVDHESTRSSKEFVRSIGVRLANHSRGAARTGMDGGNVGGAYKPSVSPPESMAGPYLFLDWNATLRDVLPKRSPIHPFALDCSPEVARQAGTHLKHSITSGICLNGCFVDDRYDPTMGYDAHAVGEVAGPPGDVGYAKFKGGFACHLPLALLRMMALGVDDEDGTGYIDSSEGGPSVIGAAVHSSFNCGLIRPLTFNGLLGEMPLPSSDRFYVGGPGQLRGFLPASIGPRANKGGSGVPGGDALGGDLFYAATLAASVPFPSHFATLRQNGARIFGFANAGTCVSASPFGGRSSLLGAGCVPLWSQILQSSRVSVGGGVSMGTPLGRCEVTYAVPVRYGPRDARKSVQFGFGFSFG
ncbi:hypothetical protein ACHAXT_007904 [Thalassiosira profunda]